MKSTTTKSKQTSGQKQTRKNEGKSQLDEGQGLRNLLVTELKDIYWAEKELTKAIPKMIKNATAPELIEALTGHLEETKEQVTRLEEVFYLMDEKQVAKKCEAMSGLIKEAQEIMSENEKGSIRDAAIILAGQKVEHYEIATYGTLCAFAKILGEHEVAALLEETLNEEKAADEKLSEIAESSINIQAVNEDEEMEEESDEDVAVAKKIKRK